MLTLDADTRALLDRVNRSVNALPYRTDFARYRAVEFWTEIDDDGGDCEDFALEKRRRLIGLGLPVDELRLAVCFDENGQGHAVLTIDTGRGTLVLDNRHREIRNFKDLPYRWISRQSGRRWVAIDGEIK